MLEGVIFNGTFDRASRCRKLSGVDDFAKNRRGFDKEHKKVVRDIRRISTEIDQLNFEQMFFAGTYADKYNRPQPMYTMNRDGFFMLVTGFTGEKAAAAAAVRLAFIKAFNAMEQKLAELTAAELERQELQRQKIRAAGLSRC